MGNDQLVLEVQRLAVIGTIVAALVGGLTGFLGSWIATMISTKAERRRQLLSIGYETGIRQWETLQKNSMELSERGYKVTTLISPVTFIYYSIKAMELMADGKLTPETLTKLHKENKELIDTLKKVSTK